MYSAKKAVELCRAAGIARKGSPEGLLVAYARSVALLAVLCLGHATGSEGAEGAIAHGFLGRWEALRGADRQMIIHANSVDFPGYEELSFRFRVIRRKEDAVEVEDTSHSGELKVGFRFWRFEDAGSFLEKPQIKVSFGNRIDRDGRPRYENTVWYVRPSSVGGGGRRTAPKEPRP